MPDCGLFGKGLGDHVKKGLLGRTCADERPPGLSRSNGEQPGPGGIQPRHLAQVKLQGSGGGFELLPQALSRTTGPCKRAVMPRPSGAGLSCKEGIGGKF